MCWFAADFKLLGDAENEKEKGPQEDIEAGNLANSQRPHVLRVWSGRSDEVMTAVQSMYRMSYAQYILCTVLQTPEAHGAQGEGEAVDLPSCIPDGLCPILFWTLEK